MAGTCEKWPQSPPPPPGPPPAPHCFQCGQSEGETLRRHILQKPPPPHLRKSSCRFHLKLKELASLELCKCMGGRVNGLVPTSRVKLAHAGCCPPLVAPGPVRTGGHGAGSLIRTTALRLVLGSPPLSPVLLPY